MSAHDLFSMLNININININTNQLHQPRALSTKQVASCATTYTEGFGLWSAVCNARCALCRRFELWLKRNLTKAFTHAHMPIPYPTATATDPLPLTHATWNCTNVPLVPATNSEHLAHALLATKHPQLTRKNNIKTRQSTNHDVYQDTSHNNKHNPAASHTFDLKPAHTYLAPPTNNEHLAHALFTTKFT